MVDLEGVPLGEHAAALQQQLDALKRALDDPNVRLDLDGLDDLGARDDFDAQDAVGEGDD
ncbi:hypothetical protein [Gulosibacter sediminis]|uniref:hypothetical protein n=1 Tax=Gulosibacter sediminis TaxID=1729695 RepID=UPI0024A7BC60|nr:hypothetical protein [Gulosibacter sediminis]